MSGRQTDWIGIDLGTSTTSASIIRQNRLDLLKPKGKSYIGSVVSFRDSTIVVDPRIDVKHVKAYTTVYETKRIIGRRYKDVEDEVAKNKWPYEVTEGEDGKAVIKVPNNPSDETTFRLLTPEYISSFVLKEIKSYAEQYDGHPFSSCVIACPVKFDAWQRQATINAGYMAGFKNVELVAEPSAAAVGYAYKYDLNPDTDHTYVVYDMGGGTFDVSVVKRKGNQFQVIRTSGDDHLGGKDVDLVIMEDVKKQLDDLNLKVNPKRLLTFKSYCKLAKEMLSTSVSTDISLDFCTPESNEFHRILQSTLDRLTKDLMDRALTIVLDTLHSCTPPLEPSDIHMVFLMGGSSRLPSVMNSLKQVFTEDQIIHDPTELCDCAIAYGASLMSASFLMKQSNDFTLSYFTKRIQSFTVSDICPQDIRVANELNTVVVIPEQTPIGFTGIVRLFPSSAKYEYAVIRILSGNAVERDKNRFLGALKIPVNKDVSSLSQSMVVKMKLLDMNHIDVVVVCEYSRRQFHSIIEMGLTEMVKKELSGDRDYVDDMIGSSDAINFLRNSIASIRDEIATKVPQKDKNLKEANTLCHDAINKSITIPELEKIYEHLDSLNKELCVSLFLHYICHESLYVLCHLELSLLH